MQKPYKPPNAVYYTKIVVVCLMIPIILLATFIMHAVSSVQPAIGTGNYYETSDVYGPTPDQKHAVAKFITYAMWALIAVVVAGLSLLIYLII